MKYLVLPAVLAATTFLSAPQANAQSAAQLANIQAACATSGAACRAAVAQLRAGIAALPPAQRRAVVANIVTTLRNTVTAPGVAPEILQNVSQGLDELSEEIDDPEQLDLVTTLEEELADGDIDDEETFETIVEEVEDLGGSPA